MVFAHVLGGKRYMPMSREVSVRTMQPRRLRQRTETYWSASSNGFNVRILTFVRELVERLYAAQYSDTCGRSFQSRTALMQPTELALGA